MESIMSKHSTSKAYNLDDIEQRARDIYANESEGQQQLLDVWEGIPAHDQHRYPDIAFHTAKVHINQGHNALARARLTICGDAWKGEPEKLARVYLIHAYLCKLEHDFEGLRQFISQAQLLSKSETLLAECQYLLGDAVLTTDPTEALQHYDEARQRYVRASVMNRDATFDAVRASLRAAYVAFQQNMNVVGWQYQHYAEEAAHQFGNSDLLSAVLMRTGDAWATEGQYDRALKAYEEAVQQSGGNPQKLVTLDYRRARLALLTGDDRTAQEIISHDIQTDHTHEICQWLLCQGWLAVMRYEIEDARCKLQEVEAIMRGDTGITNQARILAGVISAQAGQSDEQTIRTLSAAMHYFDERRMMTEAGQATLVLAWLYALAGDLSYVAATMDRLERTIQRLGHVQHLARLYQVSIVVLGGWWQEETVRLLEQALVTHQSGDGVRVYAFGIPRVYVGSGELKQRDRYGRIGIQLMLYMLEKRQAQMWEIVEALWEGGEPESGQRRFHTLMGSFKKALGVSDWCTYSPEQRVYTVKEGFPHYYDADDFKDTFAQLPNSENTMQSLAHCMKLINLYSTFARTFDSEAFEQLRHQYEARFFRTLTDAERLLPAVADVVPRPWYEQLSLMIDVNALS
jgi:hypothetical protein